DSLPFESASSVLPPCSRSPRTPPWSADRSTTAPCESPFRSYPKTPTHASAPTARSPSRPPPLVLLSLPPPALSPLSPATNPPDLARSTTASGNNTDTPPRLPPKSFPFHQLPAFLSPKCQHQSLETRPFENPMTIDQ